jgi:hypothetical protein
VFLAFWAAELMEAAVLTMRVIVLKMFMIVDWIGLKGSGIVFLGG